MFGWFKGKGHRAKHPHPVVPTTPAEVLAALEERLVDLIPNIVRGMRVSEPVFCLRIWYFEGVTPPNLTLCTEVGRQRVISQKEDLVPYYLWCGDEAFAICSGQGPDIQDPFVSAYLVMWYTHPECGGLLPIRQLVQRVAARLNKLNWEAYIPATSDFVVFGADGAHEWCDDYGDMTASISPERLASFREQGMLGPPNRYYSLKDEDNTSGPPD